ncbi:ABC transporter permease subunit [Gimesia panareensis]|uniref:ABC-2 family transporter protein n=1 Tax=Gimesia panareensis TaxID=2527978 RepID=A0A518A1F2_9PLAN|nr:ABC transporter permease subunit [Gimesia panareensis]QDT25594.1 ABC-2 family transporter protein [Gimesia panareensis]QDU48539.1 ABC-2 family transporter protein [Gimesia panareensis]
MFNNPIFIREALTSPRQIRHYLIRSGYVAAVFILIFTAGQTILGTQQIQTTTIGEFARLGNLIFQMISFLQLLLVMFFTLLFSAGSIAQEKDRGTLILLLMTELKDRELVSGKTQSSLLIVYVLLAASVPVCIFLHLLGGVELAQILWMELICLITVFATGSWAALVAFWREKTFQTLAISVLGMVVFLGVVELLVGLLGPSSALRPWIAGLDPFRALYEILNPLSLNTGLEPISVSAWPSLISLTVLGVALRVFTVFRLRVWNPSRSVYKATPKAENETEKEAVIVKEKSRSIWANPVIWREIMTKAYGRKVFVIKLAYFLLAGFLLWSATSSEAAVEGVLYLGVIPPQGLAFAGIAWLSLVLANTQAVTSITSEKDSKTLELLLVTDISAKEFVLGKLGGIFYNSKELILVPVLILCYLVSQGAFSTEGFLCALIGFLALMIFSIVLGLHMGLTYDNSRSAIGGSLGTMFFLFIGIGIFMILLVQARSSFALQLQSFLVFIVVGSAALHSALTHRNPSRALAISAWLLPFLTFYAITSFLLGGTLGVLVTILFAYGLPVLSMYIPAVSEFDVALGKTTYDKG